MRFRKKKEKDPYAGFYVDDPKYGKCIIDDYGDEICLADGKYVTGKRRFEGRGYKELLDIAWSGGIVEGAEMRRFSKELGKASMREYGFKDKMPFIYRYPGLPYYCSYIALILSVFVLVMKFLL